MSDIKEKQASEDGAVPLQQEASYELQDPEKHQHGLGGLHSKTIERNNVAFDMYAHTHIPREKVEIEERMWYANAQRKTYGMHDSSVKRSFTDKAFALFDNPMGPRVPENPLIVEDEPFEDYNHEVAIKSDRWSAVAADAARAKSVLRVATWHSAFYLMTTDAIGPFNAPFAIAQLGWVPGIMSYFSMGIATFYSSWLLTNLFIRYDSDRHPVRTFADLMYIFFGNVGFWLAVLCQVLQLYPSAAGNTLGASQSVYLLANNGFCFIAILVLMAAASYLISLPLKSMQWLGWMCSSNVYLNLFILFTSMGFFAHSPPNYAAAQATLGDVQIPGPPFAPVMTQVIVSGDLSYKVNGISNAIFAWGALQMFVEFLAEMRQPQMFWKSFTGGETLCILVYLCYGSYVYYFQGQYTQSLAYQGIGNQKWADIGNGISVYVQVTATVLYLHIVLKVLWQTIAEDIFKLPSVQLPGWRGWIWWFALNTVWYPLVLVLAAAIPQLDTLTAFFAALFGVHFSFTFPPLMQLASDFMSDASREDGVYVPGEPQAPKRRDGPWSMSRIKRGLFTGRVGLKALNLLYFLTALSLSGLATWGSVETMIATFANSSGKPFSCSPFV